MNVNSYMKCARLNRFNLNTMLRWYRLCFTEDNRMLYTSCLRVDNDFNKFLSSSFYC